MRDTHLAQKRRAKGDRDIQDVLQNGACGCGSIFGERQVTFQEVADVYNKNKDPQFRQEILDYFRIQ